MTLGEDVNVGYIDEDDDVRYVCCDARPRGGHARDCRQAAAPCLNEEWVAENPDHTIEWARAMWACDCPKCKES